ncbi:hypothetical protein P5673_026293 [Acropora cervicornis]|uniref:Uncharacterized protein n=1 Tax=Acropora cervicornis TaxID=6130 RepID=A0AAD9UWL7_ACRCE|nr:hypothetical protein P5673_026293 [Acropora cervicornis]
MTSIFLFENKLSHIQRGMFQGIGSSLSSLNLAYNSLSSAPDLTGLNSSPYILLEHNQITDVRPLGKSGNMEFLGLYGFVI